MKLGFDNEKYLKEQSEEIRRRAGKYGRLYLEFGGKLMNDFHAARCLPGYDPNVKLRLLQTLKDQAEVILCLYAGDIERKKMRADFGISYADDALKLIDDLRSLGLLVRGVVITRYQEQHAVKQFRAKLEHRGVRVYYHYKTAGYPADVDTIVSDIGYGKNEYVAECGDNGYDGNWGIFDEPFLQFMAKKIGTFRQPFFTSVFTISSHHPYTMPEEHVGQFPKGKHPILEVVAYSDYALKQFFAAASKADWYQNTIFIITADHTAPPISPKYSTGYNVYKVPMIVFDPSNDTHIVKNRIMQQADIMPTVVDMLGINEKTLAFGKSVINPANPEYHISYGSSAYQLIKDKYYIRYDGTKLEVFDRLADPELKNDLAESDAKAYQPQLNFLKAIIQQYNNRMIENRLTIK